MQDIQQAQAIWAARDAYYDPLICREQVVFLGKGSDTAREIHGGDYSIRWVDTHFTYGCYIALV